MKLFTADISPNCRRVEATIFQLEMEDDVEIERISFTSGRLQSDDYRAINPNGKVPVLIHEDRVMWESNAIMQYLCDEAGAKDFFPQDHRQRADIVRWQFWECLHFNKAVGTICWETIAKPAFGMGAPDQDIIKDALAEYHRFAAVLNGHLDGRAYILGDTMTLADFSVGSHSALVLNPQSQVPLDAYEGLHNWYVALENAPAWAKTAPKLHN